MEFSIRHVQDEDVAAVHDIFLSPHVVLGTMRLPIQPLEYSRKRLELEDGVVKMVAHVESEIVGYAELITYPNVPRHRHAGEINMIVTHEEWRGKGVARALMAAMIDLGDNWLNLTRLGLTAWTTNESAVRLYEQFGFEIEGTMLDYVFREGTFADAYVMGRVTRKR